MSVIGCEIDGKIFDRDRYSLRIVRCGEEFCLPDKMGESKLMSCYTLHFVMYGAGNFKFGDGPAVRLKRGDAFLLYVGEKYEYAPSKSDPWSYGFVDFVGEGVDELFACCGFTREKPYLSLGRFEQFGKVVRDLVDSYDASEVQSINCMANFMLLIGKMIKVNKFNSPEQNRMTKKLLTLHKALIFLNDNYRMDLDIGTIASAIAVSSDYIKHLFPEMIGMTVKDYLHRFRLSVASSMLQYEVNSDISSIAKTVGYNDQAYFTRVFVKYKGTTPSVYRRTHTFEDPFAWLGEMDIDFRSRSIIPKDKEVYDGEAVAEKCD